MMQKHFDRYARVEVPPYEFREFPKQIVGAAGKPIIVQNAEEEVRLNAERILAEEKTANNTRNLEQEYEEKGELLHRAGKLGMNYDKRWGLARLRDAVLAAEAEAGI